MQRILLLMIALVSTGLGETLLYVAPDGRDTGSGTLSSPFATLARARDEIRHLKASAGHSGLVTVFVRGGTYELTATLGLDARDSGTAVAPVVYRAYRNEKPVLTAAHRISDFVLYKGRILKSDMAAQGMGGIYFRQLFYSGRRQQLARYPNFDAANPYIGGWAHVDGKSVPKYSVVPGEDKHTLRYRTEDDREWAHPEEGEVMVFPRYNWWNNIVPVKSRDRETRTLTLGADCSYPVRPGDRYFVRNLLEELDAPGEWYLDKGTGTLYFWPPDNATNPLVYAPRLRTILQLDKGTAYVTFRGFTFENFESTAISLTDTEHCLIAGNVIRNGGDYYGSGVVVTRGTNNGVVGNDIYEIGRNGVMLTGGDRVTLTPADNHADNNHIHHTGVFFKQGVGIDMLGCGLRASHNLIHDLPRMALIFNGPKHIIEYNEMHHVNLETEDTGVIVTGGRDWISARGSVVRYNYMHDSIGMGQENGRWVSPHFSWGIYLDDNTGGVDVIGNIVVRAYRGLIHLHNGRDNLIENNIFIDGKLQQAEFSGWTSSDVNWINYFPMMVNGYNQIKDQPAWKDMRNIVTSPSEAVLPDGLTMTGNVFRHNIVYAADAAARLFNSRNLPLDHNEWDNNVYWHDGLPLRIQLAGKLGEVSFDQWRAKGLDRHSVVADPKFVNPGKDDYRLRPDSPALGLGFKPIPIQEIGLYKSDLRVSWPIEGISR